MKKYEDFINEELTSEQDKYGKLMQDLFWNNGRLNSRFNYDLNGYMMVNCNVDFGSYKMFTEDLEEMKQRINFIEEISKIAIDPPRESKARDGSITIFFTFDFRDMNNIPNIFKSYNTITKFKL